MRHISLASASCLSFLLLGTTGPAQSNEPTPRISVSGLGTAEVAADMAVVQLSVVEQAKTAREALTANSQAMAAVLAAMEAAGIAPRDLQTSDFSINPRYENSRSNDGSYSDPKIIGYSVQNSLAVRVRDLSMLGATIDQSVSLGVNSGGGITFTNDDPSAVLQQARIEAMGEAIAKAKTLTEAANVGLGRILEISETSQRPGPMPMMRAEMAMARDSSVPIASGENTYSVTVNVTFEIDQ